ncbi:MAG: AAA family ATPase [Desulfuromonadales bacterium]|nr:AAA family ATPase [Desulfuromonadales bacterium]
MYTTYFGFREKPFTLTPNPRFIFLSRNHKEAFAHLLYGINNHYGFIALTGEVGTGKTTILRTLLGQLQDDAYRTALIFSPCLTSIELLRSINSEFGVDSNSEYANELLADLNRFLLAETAAGKTVVLVIDESQNLQPEVLEQIRLISNLETENDKLIQIILVGQPELETLLGRPDLRQLNQRIAVRYQLGSMNKEETLCYIRQRMEVAGETGGVSFSGTATALIYLSTGGVPRMINILCDRALLIAYGDECRRITPIIVIRAMWELLNHSQERRFSKVTAGLIGLAVLICLAGIASRWLPESPARQNDKPAPIVITSQPQPVSSEKAQAQTTEKLGQEIVSYDQNDTHILVFNTLAELWEVRPIKVFSEGLDIPDMFRRIAAKRKLRVTLFKGSLDDVIRYDLPFVVATRITGDLGEYCYAVTAVQQDGTSLSIAPALFDGTTISRIDLASIASGTYYLVWHNSGQIPDTISPGEKRFEIRALQQLLKQADFYQDALDGTYSDATASAVKRFQRAQGIPLNESLGELTLAALSRYDTNHKVPSLKGS